jgi:hypothetical protein
MLFSSCYSEIPDVGVFIFSFLTRKKIACSPIPKQLNWCGLTVNTRHKGPCPLLSRLRCVLSLNSLEAARRKIKVLPPTRDHTQRKTLKWTRTLTAKISAFGNNQSKKQNLPRRNHKLAFWAF